MENEDEKMNKLILALDVDSADEARGLVARLRDVVAAFKIGPQLFTAEGPQFVRELVSAGTRIFLDLKFHDIPNTVAAAGVAATRLGVWMFNIHASGGSEMMRRTVDAVAENSVKEGLSKPIVIAVTLLTSSDASTLAETGIDASPEQQVIRLARLAESSGIDGVVASPLEIRAVRSAVVKENFVIVTPGVRPTDTALNDQRRVMTPEDAIKAGADFVVVGRAVLNASDPVRAAIAIREQIEIGLS